MRTIEDVLRMNGNSLRSVGPESTVIDTLKLMKDMESDALPVLEAGKLVGVIKETDCITKVILKGKSLETTQVWEAMIRNTLSVTPAQAVEGCLAFMNENQLRHLPVISDGALVGFVSMGDLFTPILTEQKEYIYRLENYVMGIGFNQ